VAPSCAVGRPARFAACLAVALVLAACGADAAGPAGGGFPPGGGFPAGDWPTYHADQARTGAVAGRSPGTVRRAWVASLGGAVRGQPLVARGRVVAATETNRVVALDPTTGRVLWSVSLGPPLTAVAVAVGCGNIDPLGITSTPVIDPATGTVFVVGTVADGPRSVHHQLVGLDLATGKVRVSAAVDPPLPPGESPLQLLQRASLALADGRVYVPYGGHAGDCGQYHGWLVGALATDPTRQVSFEVAADAEGGAIWQSGGAPAVDAQGNVYVSTGNSNPFPGAGPDPARYSESVVKLAPDLRPVAAFQDPAAGGDGDFGTGNPVLLPDGTLFAVGKTDVGFVLSQRDLGRVATIPGICGSDPDGGPAYDPATGWVFVPCRGGGIQVVDARSHTLGPRWSGADSAPIVVGGDVWAADSGTGTLTAFAAASGRVGQVVDVGADLPVFTSPSTGAGLLLVGTADGVTAFR
jgi:polyvinyl alcohol dehydrogenase (cytochrome)